MSGRLEGSAKAEWRENWTAVMAGVMGVGLVSIYLYSTGIMIKPLEEEFGWTRAQISLGPTIVAVIGCIAAPFMGMVIDRFGPRRIGITGAILICSALAMLSQANASIWSWYALWLLVAIAHPFIKPTVWVTAVSSLFSASRGLALAITLSGIGFGSAVTPILLNYLIDAHGWRLAYVYLGGIFAILSVPILFFFFYGATDKNRLMRKAKPSEPPLNLPGMGLKEAIRSARFIKLAVATSAISVVTVALGVNLVPILSDAGIDRTTAAWIAGISGVGGLLGKLTGGWLLDRYHAGKVVGIATLCPGISCAILIAFPGSVPAAAAAVAIWSFAMGVEFDGMGYLASRHFGLRNFGAIFGAMAGLLALTGALGPYLSNYIFDVTRSYMPVLWAAIPTAFGAGILFMILGPYPVFETPAGDKKPADPGLSGEAAPAIA